MISALWNDLLFMLGVNTTRQSPDELNRHMIRMSDFLYRIHGRTTVEEIRLAFELACEGELDCDVISALNPLQFGRIMSAYRRYAAKSVAIQQKNSAKLPELPPPAELIQNVMKSAFVNAYRLVKSGDTYPDYGSKLYDWLDEQGLMPYDNERKWAFYHVAKGAVQQLIADTLQHSNHLSKTQKAPLKETLKQCMNDVLDRSTADKIRAHAKYLALNQLMKDLIDLGTLPAEYLPEIQSSK